MNLSCPGPWERDPMVMQDGDAEHALAQETTQSFPRQVDGYVEL